MTTTEQIARETYHQLDPCDKRVVRAWRNLGNDWVTSIVNSGAPLTSHRTRTYPDQAQRTELRAYNHG
jgi:hypothetical protein